MRFHKIFVTTKTYFGFSNKDFSSLKQFLYGNTFTLLDAFWVFLYNLFFFLLGSVSSSFFRVNSDKETSLVVVEKHNPSDSSVYEDQKPIGFHEKQVDVDSDDESFIFREISVVSISKRCDFFSDKSITGFVEEPKVVCFIVHDYSAVQEKKMVTLSDESNTCSIVLEKPFIVENKFDKSQSVYEFMSFGVLKELLVHENFAGLEENLFDDDGFIELNPSFQISNIAYGEGEEEEDFMQREEQLNMGFEEQEVYDFDDDGSDSDDDDDDDDDEFEHSDVIERLKTELRSARTGGLCTILEESETPLEELKPLKIEPKPDQLKDRIAEIHKVYKIYAVKMRKLDVMDSQTMHSISKSSLTQLTNCNFLS